MYYTKFIKAYQKEGVNVWGISIQMNQWQSNVGKAVCTLLKKNKF